MHQCVQPSVNTRSLASCWCFWARLPSPIRTLELTSSSVWGDAPESPTQYTGSNCNESGLQLARYRIQVDWVQRSILLRFENTVGTRNKVAYPIETNKGSAACITHIRVKWIKVHFCYDLKYCSMIERLLPSRWTVPFKPGGAAFQIGFSPALTCVCTCVIVCVALTLVEGTLHFCK